MILSKEVKVKWNGKNKRHYIEKRYDVLNGVTLCNKCHLKFHSLYGKNENNLEQLQEFFINQGKDVC